MLLGDFGGTLPRVAALGGGHGLAANLTALKRVTDQLTAIVTVADDGGSSGRLRQEFDILPPGDLRMALAALCDDTPTGRAWAELLQTRFAGAGSLAGHAVGNLLLAGAWQAYSNDPIRGLRALGRLIGARGEVLPMSAIPLEIEAEVLGDDPLLPDEVQVLHGQVVVAETRGEVRAVRLIPDNPPAAPEAVEAITAADWVVLGPGSWFSSVIPHLCVPQLQQALIATTARRILTLNLEPIEETEGFTAARHIELLAEHAPTLRLDYVIADHQQFAGRDKHLRRYAAALGAELIVSDVAARDGSARHDPLRLGSVYAEVMGL
ncbi:MAG: gluconeogenesis factor YvcK family protein [Propionibacteriaceae bacterium]